jgi:hypothetical protein
MANVLERLQAIWSAFHARRYDAALASLDALEAEEPDAEPGDRGSLLQARSAICDALGRAKEALAAIEAALEIDRTNFPGTGRELESLHSIVLIERRAGLLDRAREHARDLLALGEKLGGMYFAAAVVQWMTFAAATDRLALLERANFACKVTLAEQKPAGNKLHQLARVWSSIVFYLADAYAQHDRNDDAERVLFAVTRLIAPLRSVPRLDGGLAVAWSKLAHLAQTRGDDHAAQTLRDFAARAKHGHDDPNAVGFSFIRSVRPAFVAHPLRGAYALADDCDVSPWAPGDPIAVLIDSEGVARPMQ